MRRLAYNHITHPKNMSCAVHPVGVVKRVSFWVLECGAEILGACQGKPHASARLKRAFYVEQFSLPAMTGPKTLLTNDCDASSVGVDIAQKARC